MDGPFTGECVAPDVLDGGMTEVSPAGLTFDWRKVEGRPVICVLGDRFAGGWSRIFIVLKGCTVVAESTLNTAQLSLSLAPEIADLQGEPVPELQHFDGRPLGWCWECRNSQGYRDAVMIALEGLSPEVLIITNGASLDVMPIDSAS